MNKTRLKKSLPWWIVIVSGLLNIFFATFFYYWVISQRFYPLPFAPKEVTVIPFTEAKKNVVNALWDRDFENLVSFLKDDRLVEDGYLVRDFALALLVHRHFFAIERVLPSPYRKITKLKLNKTESMPLFDKLSDEAFSEFGSFIEKERWPFSTEGLFKKLKENPDPSLMVAFMQSEEFLAVATLFQRAKKDMTQEEVFDFLKQGDWETFIKGYELLAQTGDFSEETYKEIVLRYKVKRPGIGQLRPLFREDIPASPPPNVHVIQEGESLWTIAQRHHVSLDDLIRINHLRTTVIRPGQTLKLP